MKPKIAIVRGKFLSKYEMQTYEPLVSDFDITAFGSLKPFQDEFKFPTIKLMSPMDLPQFPYKMPIINRIFKDGHVLFGLEDKLKGFDLVHSAETYFYYTQQALNAKKKGNVKKVITTVLDNIPFNNEGIRGRKGFKKRTYSESDHLIAFTERTKIAMLLEGADERKITVAHYGISTDEFYPNKDKISKLGDPSKKNFDILFAGRLEVYKGVFDILYAAKLLLDDPGLKDYKFNFTFVGDGTQRKQMYIMEDKLGIKKIITHKTLPYSQIVQEYQNADIYLAPSKSSKYWVEQYNTTLMEAQACGLPIVSTLSGGIVENVGDAGILIQPDDPLSIYENIKKLVLDPELRVRYSRLARKRAVEIHDTRLVSKKIKEIYEMVLSS